MSVLTRRRLEWLVRCRGTDLADWPVRERAAALALLRSSPEAQAAFAEALAREEMAEAEGERAVLERMQCALRQKLAPLSALMRGLSVAALAACVAAGLMVAISQSDPDLTPDPFTTAQTVSFASLDQ